MEIRVNSETCIKCSKCVKVCPSVIFSQKGPISDVQVSRVEACISCGHCVSVCPTASVVHSEFPRDRVHEIDYSQMPTPDQVMLLCRARRSNRAFLPKPIPEAFLDRILEAAHLAPTASNKQQVEFTLVTDPELLDFITQSTIDVFSGVVKRLKNPFVKAFLKPFIPSVYGYVPQFDRLILERAAGRDLILRGARAVIFIHTPKDSRFGCQDANLAYQNGSLMAESLGVSQFYTGFVCSAIHQDKQQRLAKKLAISGTIHAGMALGMASFRFPNYVDRHPIVVKKSSK